jgi:hypothetical protein
MATAIMATPTGTTLHGAPGLSPGVLRLLVLSGRRHP